MFGLLLISLALASEFHVPNIVRAGKSASEWKSRIIYQLLTDRFAKNSDANSTCSLSNYCGGTYKGIINHLDYIKNLGMNAIWISPIVQNTDGSYHGYHATNFYALNTNFGSENDLKTLISECHKRDIWVMVDVVYNHVGPVGTDYSGIYPFNQASHYHSYCDIDYSSQTSIENCRIAGLPDLNQTVDWVREELISWTHWLMSSFDIDGLRVDTVKHVHPDFWQALVADFPNLYMLGETFNGDPNYLKTYTDIMAGQFSYPMYYTINNVYADHQSCYQIRTSFSNYENLKIDNTRLGGFLDNHDNPRWLNHNGDWTPLRNALCFNLLTESIPVLYYGTEQGYSGGADPANREPLWWSGYNQNHELYQYIKKITAVRKTIPTTARHVEAYCDDDFYAFTRGDVLVCTSSKQTSYSRNVTYLPFKNGDTLKEVFSGKTYTINNGINIEIQNGMPQIWVKA